MNREIKRKVDAGVKLLDNHDREWRTKVDTSVLDMGFHGLCLLSQIFVTFERGIQRLGIGSPLPGEEVRDTDGWQYGFTVSPWVKREEVGTVYARLTEEWRKRVEVSHGAV